MDTGISNISRTISPVGSSPELKKVQLVDKKEDAKRAANDALKSSGSAVDAEDEKKNALNKDDLSTAVKQINSAFQEERRSIQFNLDQESGRTVIKVVDSTNGKEIRQIPSEDVLEISRKLSAQLHKNEDISGMLLKSQA